MEPRRERKQTFVAHQAALGASTRGGYQGCDPCASPCMPCSKAWAILYAEEAPRMRVGVWVGQRLSLDHECLRNIPAYC